MPFDPAYESFDRPLLVSLVQRADEAWMARDQAGCIDIINRIYDMLDRSTAPQVVNPRAQGISVPTSIERRFSLDAPHW